MQIHEILITFQIPISFFKTAIPSMCTVSFPSFFPQKSRVLHTNWLARKRIHKRLHGNFSFFFPKKESRVFVLWRPSRTQTSDKIHSLPKSYSWLYTGFHRVIYSTTFTVKPLFKNWTSTDANDRIILVFCATCS